MNINEIGGRKTAATIVSTVLKEDRFHRRIKEAAQYLEAQGRGHLVYSGQYQRGETIWSDPQTGASEIVRPQEVNLWMPQQ